ncbi:hypothetical protein COJ25_17115 [Bacillus cereus]|nr:hypothetical protein COJ25_17115 [Bacillus cereus]
MVSLSAYLKYKTKGDVHMDELRINELNDFQEKVMRTWNNQPFEVAIVNAALGLTGEAGEVADNVKKAEFHGHGWSGELRHNTAMEIGDIMYYAAVAANELGYNLQEVCEMVINKLAKRYPEGFSVEASINRVDTKEAH